MTDMNAQYVNNYINTALEALGEDLKEKIDLRTKVKMLNDVIASKEKQIGQLSTNNVSNASLIEEVESWKKAHDTIKGLYDTVSTKASHLDVALGQIVEMKKTIKEQQEQINKLTTKPKRTPKQKILNKVNTSIAGTDDF